MDSAKLIEQILIIVFYALYNHYLNVTKYRFNEKLFFSQHNLLIDNGGVQAIIDF